MKETISSFPKTKVEAVNRILSVFSEESKETLRNTPKGKLGMFHFSLGMFIRNKLGLWKGNKELMEDCYGKPSYYYDPDQISGIIIEAVWERLQGTV